MKKYDSKVIIWLLLLVAFLTVVSLTLLTIFGFADFNNEYYRLDENHFRSQQQLTSHYDTYVKTLKNEIISLRMRIKNLEQQLNVTIDKKLSLSTSTISPDLRFQTKINGVNYYDCSTYIRKQVGTAEVLHGLPFNNEYELTPFNHFTFTRVYPIELGLGKRVVEKPIGRKRKDLLDALKKAIDSLNRNSTADDKYPLGSSKFTLDDFIEGIYRTEPTTGTQYELYFQKKSVHKRPPPATKVIVMRPFAPLQTVQILTKHYGKMRRKNNSESALEFVHIVLPLSGRIAQFKVFIDNFIEISKKKDSLVKLLVVYFGQEAINEAKEVIRKAVTRLNEKAPNLKIIQVNETFSRAKGLRIGAEKSISFHNKSSNDNSFDPLLFLCDVDIIFNERFLNRCRWNSDPGKMVYYPVVFSLYNPQVVYTLQGKLIPPESEQLQITKENGFWRDFGYGMTCQYRSDFLELRGFDEEIIGWGGEDVMLYRKYVRSKIKIIRATDPGIFHMWHPKVCQTDKSEKPLSDDQYRACIRSRALNEASHAQLGFLAFRDEIAVQNNGKHQIFS